MKSRKNINIATGRLTEKALEIADVVLAVASELNCTPAQVALAWTLLNPAVTSPIIGARTLQQLEDNLGALKVEFNNDQISRLNDVSRIELRFPNTLIDTPTGNMMFGNVKVQKR